MHDSRTMPESLDLSFSTEPNESQFDKVALKFQLKGFKTDFASKETLISSILKSNDRQSAPPPLLFVSSNNFYLKLMVSIFTVTDNSQNNYVYKAIVFKTKIGCLFTRDLLEEEWALSFLNGDRSYKGSYIIFDIVEAAYSLYSINDKVLERDEIIKYIEKYPKNI